MLTKILNQQMSNATTALALGISGATIGQLQEFLELAKGPLSLLLSYYSLHPMKSVILVFFSSYVSDGGKRLSYPHLFAMYG